MLNTCLNSRHVFAGLMLVMAAFTSSPAAAQNRVDLDDLNIKGELLNDNRLRMSARDQHQLADRVSYRNNFRKEVTDGLEVSWPEENRAPASADRSGQ